MPLRVALTGQTHGPELAPLLKLMPLADRARPARVACSKSIIRSPARSRSSSRCGPNEVRMYVCGITMYDYIHVGHARMLTVFDLVQRYLRSIGYDVTYVRNITDIDDKIIQRAAANGRGLGRARAQIHRGDARGLRAARARAAGPRAARHRVHRPDHRDDADARSTRATPTARRTAMSCTRCASSRRTARSPARRIDDLRAGCARADRRVQAGPAGLRAVEARQAGRALVGVAVGRRPSGLAHRMLGDVDESARQLFRSARRRRWI